jgi:cell division protease FtsH
LLVFDSASTGASDDLERASELAINMVGSLGFSDAFGLLSAAGVPKELLGPDIQAGVLREARARVLLERVQARCQQLVKANRAQPKEKTNHQTKPNAPPIPGPPYRLYP